MNELVVCVLAAKMLTPVCIRLPAEQRLEPTIRVEEQVIWPLPESCTYEHSAWTCLPIDPASVDTFQGD